VDALRLVGWEDEGHAVIANGTLTWLPLCAGATDWRPALALHEALGVARRKAADVGQKLDIDEEAA
jgi:hypothetical protein